MLPEAKKTLDPCRRLLGKELTQSTDLPTNPWEKVGHLLRSEPRRHGGLQGIETNRCGATENLGTSDQAKPSQQSDGDRWIKLPVAAETEPPAPHSLCMCMEPTWDDQTTRRHEAPCRQLWMI